MLDSHIEHLGEMTIWPDQLNPGRVMMTLWKGNRIDLVDYVSTLTSESMTIERRSRLVFAALPR